MKAEQQKIEDELMAFEKTVWGDPEKKDSLDSIANAQADVKVKKKRSVRTSRRGDSPAEASSKSSEKEPKVAREPKVRSKRASTPSSSSSGSARVSVRRQRH